MLSRGVEQLLGRASGPLHFRLVITPTVVAVLAIRAGLKDAREGHRALFWGLIANPAERRRRLLTGWKDIARILIVAMVLDTAYQLMVLRAFYVVQTLIVAVVCGIVPYVLFRGPVTRLASSLSRKQARATNTSAANPAEAVESRPESQDHVDT
jgi:hypothetical protein